MSKLIPVLQSDIIYIGDNGRMFCGELKCAGMSAHYTGISISGLKVRPIKTATLLELKIAGFTAECSSCKKVMNYVA